MRDLRGDIQDLWRNLSRTTPAEGGQLVMFLAAREGDGTSSIAASFAMLAAAKARRSTWLIDLDLSRNGQFKAFERGDLGRVAGRPGRAFDASLNQPQFYALSPAPVSRNGEPATPKLLSLHPVGQSRLLVTAFRNEALLPGQKVRVRTQPAYWRAVRAVTDWGVVDAPALERSGAGLVMAGQMDAVVLVLSADGTPAEDARSLRREVEAHGGRCAGFVLNRARSDARLVDRLFG